MSVLVCTSSGLEDKHVPTVIEAIRARGTDCFVLDTARFPLGAGLSLRTSGSAQLRIEGETVSLGALSSVWMLHVQTGESLGGDVDEDFHQAVSIQSELALYDALAATDALFVDHPLAQQGLPIGIHQLRLAAAEGLHVPRTLCSNDPEEVRTFFEGCGGRVVAKMMQSSAVQQDTPDGPRAFGPRLLGERDLAEIDRVAICPELFQEAVEKVLDLRITVVGSRLFAAAVETRYATALDWAEAPNLVRAFRPYPDLPAEVSAAILRLLTKLRLNFGTVDLILTPAGEYVFLETNSVTFFDFIVGATALPICDALAELLTGTAEPRVRVRWPR